MLVFTDPVIEPDIHKWYLYSAKDVRIKSSPIFDILPLVDTETLDYIKEKLMICDKKYMLLLQIIPLTRYPSFSDRMGIWSNTR